MFTGIIQNLGTVTHLEPVDNALKIRVATSFSDLELGESVAVNGVCLTVAEKPEPGARESAFFLSPETLIRSTLGELKVGASVNLERALRAGDRLSGHWVQGHVDGMAKLVSITPMGGGSHQLFFSLPERLLPYLVEKGSICLDGISLTVNSLKLPDLFDVAIIPHTWEVTHLARLRPGDSLNVEVDILAKYLLRLSEPFFKSAALSAATASAAPARAQTEPKEPPHVR